MLVLVLVLVVLVFVLVVILTLILILGVFFAGIGRSSITTTVAGSSGGGGGGSCTSSSRSKVITPSPTTDHMIPRTRITVQHRLRLYHLPSITSSTPATRISIMRLTPRALPKSEQLPQTLTAEMPLHILCTVHDTTAQGLLVTLPHENLLLDTPRRDKPVRETILPLSVTPHARKCLLVCRRVPVGVEEDESVRADQVDAAAACFGGEEEHGFGGVERVVEAVD